MSGGLVRGKQKDASAMNPFFRTQSLAEVHGRAESIEQLDGERVSLEQALGRTLAYDLQAAHDLPGFARSTMDGYAVRSRDTFGASESSPAFLAIAGDVQMGHAPDFALVAEHCARIGTGGMLPEGADAVVMVENTRLVETELVEVTRAVSPGANVTGSADDAKQGDVILRSGELLRPQEIGLLAAMGICEVGVFRRPRVGIISSGDEVVPIDRCPAPGQVRDVNTHTLTCQVQSAGGIPQALGLAPDNEEALRSLVESSLNDCDLTLLSGGSSVGARDLTAKVFMSFPGAELLVHGVSVAPGKPFIWVRAGNRHMLGLPGQLTSCMIAFHLFVEPIMERFLGRPARAFTRFGERQAILTCNLPGSSGRETFVRVRIFQQEGRWMADPLFGKSGLIRTLTQSQGVVRVPLGHEGLDRGATVDVLLFP